MTIQSIFHMTSCCGGGKSTKTMSALPHYVDQQVKAGNDCILVVASITMRVSKQNLDTFAQSAKANGLIIDHALIDTSCSKQVRQDVDQYLSQRSVGVVFISHEVAVTLDPRHLRRATLIFDEVPSTLVSSILLQYEVITGQDYPWEQFLVRTPSSSGSKLEVVTLNPAIPKTDIQTFLQSIQKGSNNVVTSNVAVMLNFLLDGHETLYFSKLLSKGKTIHTYSGIDWSRLKHITSHAKEVAVLGAGFKSTSLGLIFEQVGKVPVHVVSPSWLKQPLQTKHKKHAIIFPLIKNGKWSSELKRKVASEALVGIMPGDVPNETVYSYMLGLVKAKLKDHFILIKNDKDEHIAVEEGQSIAVITPKSHGSNAYTQYHHAAFLASMRPNPTESNTYKQFAISHNVNSKDLMDALILERCHEACYQSLARSSLRQANNPVGEPHLFIVPDQEYADYVASWFEPGYVSFDHTLAHEIRTTKGKASRDDLNISRTAQIIIDNKAGKGTLPELAAREGISLSTYENHRKKYKAQLQEMGLIN